jgi:hypothetical protein
MTLDNLFFGASYRGELTLGQVCVEEGYAREKLQYSLG